MASPPVEWLCRNFHTTQGRYRFLLIYLSVALNIAIHQKKKAKPDFTM